MLTYVYIVDQSVSVYVYIIEQSDLSFVNIIVSYCHSLH